MMKRSFKKNAGFLGGCYLLSYNQSEVIERDLIRLEASIEVYLFLAIFCSE